MAQSSVHQASVSSLPLIDSNGTDQTYTGDIWIGFDVDKEATEVIKAAPHATDEVSGVSSFKSKAADDHDENKSSVSDDSVFNSPSSSSTSTSYLKNPHEGGPVEEDAYNYVFANKVFSLHFF